MRVAKRKSSVSVSLPAPIGGWNSRDSLGEMEETDAVDLINWYARTSDVMLRKGHSQFATGLPTQTETLISYNGADTQELFAISNGNIYDISAGGAVGAAEVTGLSNSRWEYTNVSTAGGNFVYAVNGIDKPRLYNGTTWTEIDGSSSPAITGVTTTTLSNVNLFKTRVWFIEKNTLKVWYLPVNAVGGAANSFDFRSIARRGGYLIAMATWTIDAGFGVDDLAVFITSEGEFIVYRGTDPSSATTWELVGVYQIGAPIGTRCHFKWQGDLLLITKDGVVPLSGALQSSRVNPKVAITDKIQSAVSTSAATYAPNFGWQLTYFAQANMLLLNVPVFEGNDQEQYVMNTITKAWARFQGWEANCWEIHNDELYFGGNMFVGKAWDTLYDNNVDISATARQAFNYFGARGQLKRWTAMRPILLTNGTLDIYAGLNVDFENVGSNSLITFAPSGFALWDTAVWDADLWAGDTIPQKAWQGVNGIGYCAAPRLQTESGGINLSWVTTDIVMERGGVL